MSSPVRRRDEAFVRFDQRLIIALAIPLQLVMLYWVPLAYECDAAVYYHYSVKTTYRGPGYPLLIWATGQYWPQTFAGTVIAHAVFGVLSPLMIYRTLAPLTRWGALTAALAFTLSLVPFTAAKLMLAEQLFIVLVIATVYFLSRYWFTRETRYIALTFAAGFGAMFTRWEAQVVLAACAVGLLIWCASTGRAHLKSWAIAALVTVLALTGWSLYRAIAMKDMRVFGTLQNGTGDQMFWWFYNVYGPEVYQWERALDPAVNELRKNDPPEVGARQHIVHEDNGPATQRLFSLIRQIARERPIEELFGAQTVTPGAGGYLTRLSGDPEQLIADIFARPSNTYVFSVPGEIRRELGPRAAQELLLDVSWEAFKRYPVPIIASKIAMSLGMVGVTAKHGYVAHYQAGIRESPFMTMWGDLAYGDVPFDLAGCTTGSLPPRMITENLWDSRLPRTTNTYIAYMSMGRNLLRNTVGPLFLLSLLLLPFMPARGLFTTIAISVLALIGVVATMGGGVYARYEYGVLPLILIVTVGGFLAVGRILSRVSRRGVSAPAASHA